MNEIGSGESRFSRWFRTAAEDAKPNQTQPENKHSESNHNENGGKNMFGQFTNESGNLNATSAAQNTFMEFLQRGKFAANMQKSHGPPHPMMDNNNPQQEFQQPPVAHQSMVNHSALSVEELEARLRQSGPSTNNSANNVVPNEVAAMKNSQQQDMIAFKKLVNSVDIQTFIGNLTFSS